MSFHNWNSVQFNQIMKVIQNLVWVENKLNSTKFTSIENFNENIKLVESKGKNIVFNLIQFNFLNSIQLDLNRIELNINIFNVFDFNWVALNSSCIIYLILNNKILTKLTFFHHVIVVGNVEHRKVEIFIGKIQIHLNDIVHNGV